MKKNFMTTQDVIDILARLYDKEGFSRADIRFILNRWRDTSCWQATESDLERVFDLIVG